MDVLPDWSPGLDETRESDRKTIGLIPDRMKSAGKDSELMVRYHGQRRVQQRHIFPGGELFTVAREGEQSRAGESLDGLSQAGLFQFQ